VFSKIVETSYQLKKIKVLYIDSDENYIESALEILKNYFENIVVSTNQDDATLNLEKNHFDFILVDIKISNYAGIELVKKIKEKNEDIFIVFFSEFDNHDYLLESMKLEVDGYIFKPIDLIQFNTIIEKVTDKFNCKFQLSNNVNYLNQYVDIVDSSTIISKTDIDGNITYVNDKFCTITGYNRAELIGKSHNILKYKDNPDEFYKDMWRTIKVEKKRVAWYNKKCLKNRQNLLYEGYYKTSF
jgi:YesN/AraC family two-component response regulator